MDAPNVWDVAGQPDVDGGSGDFRRLQRYQAGPWHGDLQRRGSYPSINLLGTGKLGATDGLSTVAAVTIGVNGAATLDLAGFDQTLLSIAKGDSATTITNSSTARDSTLTLTGTSTYTSAINDKGVNGSRIALVVNGGSLALSVNMTFSGGTTIKSGKLIASGSNAAMGKGW